MAKYQLTRTTRWAGAVALFALLAGGGDVWAQGDGPRSQLLLPQGITAVVPTYLDLTSNLDPSGTILVPGAEVSADLWVVSLTRAFSIGGRYAQLWVTPIGGEFSGRVTVLNPQTGQPVTLGAGKSGLSDPIVAFKLGLVGTPALGLPEFAQTPPRFQLSAYAATTVPVGDYDSSALLNLGTNRWSLRLGVPMVVPLGDPRSQTHWEIFPSITLYEDNDDIGVPGEIEQDPLFALETHLSRNFSPKLWGSLDLRYRQGGETTTAGVADGNEQEVLGAGVTLGYSLTRFLSIQTSFGEVLSESDGSELEMIRVRMAILF